LKREITKGRRSGFACVLHLREPVGGNDRWTVENAGPFGPIHFSPDSKLLAVANGDDQVQLLEAATGKARRSLTVKRQPMRTNPGIEEKRDQMPQVLVDLAIAPDGKTLVTVSQELLVEIWNSSRAPRSFFTFWNVANGKVLQQEWGKSGSWYGPVRFLPDGKVVAWEANKRLVDLRSGRLLFLALGAYPDRDPFLSRDGKICVWHSDKHDDYRMHLVDVTGAKAFPALERHRGPFAVRDVSPDGQTAAGGGWTLRLWDVTGKSLHVLRGHSERVEAIAFSPDGKTLASGGYDGKVYLWETATGQVRQQFRGHRGWVQSVYFAPTGRLLVSAGAYNNPDGNGENETYLWDVTGRCQSGQPKEPRFSSTELSGLWSDLAGEDAAKAFRAVWALVAAPRQSVALLRERLRPADDRQIARWIAELDSDEFKVREQAHKSLEKQGETAEFALREALRETSSVEVRRRIHELLEKRQHASLAPKNLQELWAVEVLEHIGTPDARRLLAALAKGAPRARLTREAKTALKRLR
ncbi:MAG: WD40 repeat domain-containing protein, partial [Gemmataceae bacterium]